MSISRKIIKLAKKIAPRWLKNNLKSSFEISAQSPFEIKSVGHQNFIQIDEDSNLFCTEASSFDFHHIFNHDFPEVTSFINLAKDKVCLLDVGASRGVYSCIFNKINPDGIAYAFEGSAQSCAAITELAEKNLITDQIKVNECMVGDHNGKGLFSLESCGYVQILENETLKKVEKNIISLDSFCLENNLTPDFIKIDVEGYEFEVIKGSQSILKEFSPVILLELHLSYLDQRGIYPEKILKFLTESSYQISDIQNNPISFSKINSSLQTTIHLIANPS